MNQYNYLIVGSGLFGTTMAYLLHQKGYKCLVIDKRPHIGGNVYTESVNGINVHKYGAHIFHTSDRRVWEFVNSFVEFNRYTNSPVAKYKGKLYNLPFNMNTFYQMWGVTTPEKAKEMIEKQRKESGIINPQYLEEQAISLIGKDIYYSLIKDYTEKQWGRKSTELPAFIIKRLPVRFTFDNNYFNDKYQGIPEGGYTRMIERMLEGVEVRLDTDYFENREYFDSIADRVIYTGEIDRFFDYRFGHLEYRTVSFETELLDYILAVKVVDSASEAIDHILAHSTGHSEAIITENEQTANLFTALIDSAAVYENTSTRFTDGGVFGLGCEIGISTQKLHARGPMGLEALNTYKNIIHSDGCVR